MQEIRTILVTTDFSELARHAYRYAITLARALRAKVVVAHVLEDDVAAAFPMFVGYVQPEVLDLTRFREEARKGAEASLASVVEEFRREKIHASSQVRTGGRAWAEIVRLAGELPADLIVMGTHGWTGLAHALVGSTAERVVRKAPCPVLTVKAPEGSGEKP